MEKKAVSQIDWILSLAIFLVFIAWFFVFLLPGFQSDIAKENVVLDLKDRFTADYTIEMDEFPLFVEYNGTGDLVPVIANYTMSDQIQFVDHLQHMVWQDRLIFLANLTDGIRPYWIVLGGNDTQQFRYYGLDLESRYASIENMTVNFSWYLPQSFNYKTSKRIKDIDYVLNGQTFSVDSTNMTDKGFVGIYTASNGNVNHTTMIFPGKTATYNFLTSTDPQPNYDFTIEMSLHNYTSYYSNNVYFGDIGYSNDSQTTSYSYDYVTFYDLDNSLSLFFDTAVDLEFEYYNDTLHVNAEMPVNKTYMYRIEFSDGDYTDVSRDIYAVRYGVKQKLEGIYLGNISANYTYLKQRWNIPDDKDFQIRVYRNSSAYSYRQTAPVATIGEFTAGTKTVYAQTENLESLDIDGTKAPMHINVRIW